MRRRPRLNSDIKLRAMFLRCTAAAFFGGGSVFDGVPQSGGDRPVESQRENQDKPVEPIGALDLAGLEIEPPGLEVREHRASRPEEFHPRPLTERCGSLSAHTAPTKQPTASLPPRSPPVASWTLTTTAWPNPLAPAA